MPVPSRSAVFACPMRYVHSEKPKKVWPPPYPAWPEITDPSTFYTLPTVASHPAIECECWPREISLDPIDNFTNRELFCLMFPDEAEAILAKYPVMTDDDFATVWNLLDNRTRSSGLARGFAATGISDPEWYSFAYFHELGHLRSFKTIRPTILEVNRIASGIFALFKKLSVTTLPACENFWDEFQKRNDTLVNYLDQALILEELRANLYAFSALDPNIRGSIEPALREVMAEDAISLFDTLANVTNEDWNAAYWLSILADYSSKDPVKRLHFLCRRRLNASWERIQKLGIKTQDGAGCWEVYLEGLIYYEPETSFIPPNENSVSAVHHLSLSDVKEMVFLESLRQQLAQFDGASLVCPFQQSGRTCCGFGHYMRAVWEQVLPEYRSAKAVLHPKTGKEIVVRPPRKTCLHYGLG